jgi:hypothetical protein
VESNRLTALAEVVHAVLASLEGPRGGERSLRENWQRLIAGVDAKLGLAPRAAAPASRAAGPETRAGAARAPSAARADSPPMGLKTLDFFGAPEAEPPRDPVVPEAAGAAGAESVEEIPIAAGVASRASDLEEIERLRGRVDELTRENDALRARSAPAASPAPSPAPAAGAPPGAALAPAQIFECLQVSSPGGLPPGELAERTLARLRAMGRFFNKLHGNLLHIYVDSLRMPVKIPPFPEQFADTFTDDERFARYLEGIRSCWKVITGSTWNHLKAWCEKQARTMDPKEIEAIVQKRGGRPWDAYKDLYYKTDWYPNLMRMVRTSILPELRQAVPDFLEKESP